ncbi:YraN family protein [Rhodovulum sp. DZ06]|uniref:YraN family protein n=1 Tax=Rhodovulum sp. DZ06 TaxID=3425126 RepID=UPI003D358213
MAFDFIPGERPFSPPKRRGGGASAKMAGMLAEQAALRRYVKGGARLLDKNWRAPRLHGNGELDLVLERDGVVIFVEVKQRRTLLEAGYSITRAQLERMRMAALAWMDAHGRWGGAMQFDLVYCDRYGAMEKVPNIWFDD